MYWDFFLYVKKKKKLQYIVINQSINSSDKNNITLNAIEYKKKLN